ncbi:MAG: hypothetical protein RQ761_03950 [Bacteroidales bacterium]|nr:hypothetical protein [Bacteroidales bacterium]
MTSKIVHTGVLLFVLLLLFSSSCKKEDDNSPPSVIVDAPLENEVFFSRDTIPLSGSANDDIMLEHIRIVLEDNNNQPVSTPKYLHPNSRNYVFSFDYIIDEPFLASGEYTLVVSAYDGRNSSSDYTALQIRGIEREFEKVLLLCRPNNLKTYLYSIDTSGDVKAEKVIDHGYQASAVNSGRRKLFMIKPEPSALYAFDLDDLEGDELLTASPPYPFFTDVIAGSSLTFVSTANGDIKGLNDYGQTVFVTATNADTVPLRVHTHFDYILSYCQRRGAPGKSIRQYYAGSGVFRAGKEITFSVTDFFSPHQSKCLIFGNEAEGGRVYEFGITENYIIALKELPQDLIKDVVEIAAGNYIIAAETGLYQYMNASNTLTSWASGLEAGFLCFDESNFILYAASEQMVYVINAGNGEIISEIPIPYPVVNMHIQYNI